MDNTGSSGSDNDTDDMYVSSEGEWDSCDSETDDDLQNQTAK